MSVYETELYKSYETDMYRALALAVQNTKKAIVPRLMAVGEQVAISHITEIYKDWLDKLVVPELEKVWVDSIRQFTDTLPKNALIDDTRIDAMGETWRYGTRTRNNFIAYMGNNAHSALSRVPSATKKKLSPTRMSALYKQLVGLSTVQVDNYMRYRTYLETGKPSVDLNEGLGLPEKKPLPYKEVDNIMDNYSRKAVAQRNSTIAITETHTMSGLADNSILSMLHDQGKLNPNLRKFWNDRNDERVRSEHINIRKMNKEGVIVNGMFVTPLGTLRYPGDPNGTARNVINCRCFVTYKVIK